MRRRHNKHTKLMHVREKRGHSRQAAGIWGFPDPYAAAWGQRDIGSWTVCAVCAITRGRKELPSVAGVGMQLSRSVRNGGEGCPSDVTME